MNVLGLFGFGMNPGACLLRDGRLVAFAEEERFTRFKGSRDLFPGRASRYCLSEGGLVLEEIDRIAFAWDATRYPYQMFTSLTRKYFVHRRRAHRANSGGSRNSNVFEGVTNILKYTPARIEEGIRLGLRAQGLTGPIPPVEYVPHHVSHSYSAYFCSPFEEAIVLTLDGSGEDLCTQVSVGRGERLTIERAIPLPHSLGWFYAAFTAYFGFTPYLHEGKLMALAGLGSAPRDDNPWPERLTRILKIGAGDYEVDPIYTRFGSHSHSERFTDALTDFITGLDPALGPLTPQQHVAGNNSRPPYLDPRYIDLAWGVQALLEEAACSLAEHFGRLHGIRNLCVAGGVGLNCKMNGALLHGTSFKRLFVQPASYDAGASIGAAMAVAQAAGDDIRNVLEHSALGPGYSAAAVSSVLDGCGLHAEECEDISSRVAAELAGGKIVGWFQGRMEGGPRALGNRSILANPQTPGVVERLGGKVKTRELWRPFCPSIPSEFKEIYFEDATEAPFMTTAFTVREEQREVMRAAMHSDHSTRPQTVTKSSNPLFHRLLTEFHARTGIPFVINTSFNVDGEPIACTPRDALRCFYSSGLDMLAVGDFLLAKT